MTVTRAKAEFRLNDVDIADLSCQTRPNLYNLRGPPMRIYMIRDLRRKSDEKHQAMNTTLEKAAQKARETKRKRQENNDAAQETRREALTQALAEYRLRFLPEGKLCKAYLTDRWRGFGKRWTLEEVVSRLRDIHIINAHIPNFVDLLDSFLWSHGGSMTLEEAEAAAERDALRRFHERQPYWEARGHRCHCGVFIP
ncbi:hypothetical protein NDA13_000895 [Ustilago tritici]|nr:hypothetical protein NDA13_000895 [Ustilago tritici]